jgi:hypothetical protein
VSSPSGRVWRPDSSGCYRSRVIPRALVLASVLGAFVLGTGCRPKATKAPYAPGQGPKAETLIADAKPQLGAIAVPEAKVIANRVMRGNLAFLAQGPGRFRGSVQISGNELVTLAFTEQGYALRYKLDAFPTGFYHGPPSSCAVEALLGVRLDTEDLVALVLGGAPIIEEPYEISDQKWDGEVSREAVTIRNAQYVQRLEFAPTGDGWQFVGSKLWTRNADGSRGTWRWSFSHEEMADRGGARLPGETRVVAPGKRKNNQLVIQYRTRDLDPAFAKTASDDGGGDAEGGGATEGGADDWGDGGDDGWEGADGGEWEGKEPEPEDAKPEPEPPKPEAAKPSVKAPPVVFTINGEGLKDRGDLCR